MSDAPTLRRQARHYKWEAKGTRKISTSRRHHLDTMTGNEAGTAAEPDVEFLASATATIAAAAEGSEPEVESRKEEAVAAPEDKLSDELGALGSLKIGNDDDDYERVVDEPEESNITAVASGDTVYSSAKTFEDLHLSEELLQGLYREMQFKRPSKIQGITLPMILTPPHKNLIAQAHNGSGKTTCFVLGMLSRVDPRKRIPQALCICPTRELAVQNMEVLKKMGTYTGIQAKCAVPGVTTTDKLPPITEQVVIGTPGTVKSWVSRKKLSVREMKVLVFDEADHMLAEDGFRDDSERIMKQIQQSNATCQVLLFSATFNETVKAFIARVIRDPNELYVRKEQLSLESVKQYRVTCPDELAKIDVVRNKLMEFRGNICQTIIFVKTRNSAVMLHESLREEGYDCTTIHGACEESKRDDIIKEFKDGCTKVLITTDLLARGFDQAQVNMVVNYDLPIKHGSAWEPNYDVYLHRVGRAGRFGRKGAIFNLVSTSQEKIAMELIGSYFSHPIIEVCNWASEEDFKVALKDAGLL